MFRVQATYNVRFILKSPLQLSRFSDFCQKTENWEGIKREVSEGGSVWVFESDKERVGVLYVNENDYSQGY